MSFADEIRSQAKTKDELAQEEARRLKDWEESSRKSAITEFKRINSDIKACISEAAKKGEFTQDGQYKILQGTVMLRHNLRDRNEGMNKSISSLINSCQIAETVEVLHHRGGMIRKFEDLCRLSLKARFGWFGDILRDATADLRHEGIETSFLFEWRIGAWNTNMDTKQYKFPFEQLSAGFQTDAWLISSLCKRNAEGKTYLDLYNNEKILYCSYKFRF